MSALPVVLTVDDTTSYLRDRGMAVNGDARVTTLTGGVSSHCLLVESGTDRWVVKQALERLAVEAEWMADPRRSLTETHALLVAHSVTPEATPLVLDVDDENHIFTMTAAPSGYRQWKELLLERTEDSPRTIATAAQLGRTLGRWHAATWDDEETAHRFDDYESLEQLRIAPFHRAIAAKYPELLPAIDQCIGELVGTRQCLVHGDFSPKNVLVGEGSPWVVDFEVAHFGAAVFDLAFLICHLLLKAIHQPERFETYRDAAQAFVSAYRATNSVAPSPDSLAWQVGCLALARVDGVSPVGYLEYSEQSIVRRIACETLLRERVSLDDLWSIAAPRPV